ncbi:hypothetical protein PV08_00930 [Exophiala spinifera]|uniref:aminodeoxychorismate synthase n=1 Tax=Exophiala spinifera TaxID=91928 RepID=A0A0D2BPA8_9EURO|nr:uncharacterized protein PV08_00930 [Exophiala spinifera]KIW20355.1 hypothetical protein PV08_00930 [Exophiala spinifera]
MAPQKTILFIDAYDSFAENIAALLRQQLSVQVTLIRIDCDISVQYEQGYQEFFTGFDAVVLGPGPGNPYNNLDVGLFNHVWEWAPLLNIPVLGICLGFQSLCAQYGLPIVRMGLPCHGHAKDVLHTGTDIFANSTHVVATNYNSLGVRVKDFKLDITRSRRTSTGSLESFVSLQSLQSTDSASSAPTGSKAIVRPAEHLELLAWDKDGWVMAVKHKDHHFHGVQFHPESCKSNSACLDLIKQWWSSATEHNAEHQRPVLISGQVETSKTPDNTYLDHSPSEEGPHDAEWINSTEPPRDVGAVEADVKDLSDSSQRLLDLLHGLVSTNNGTIVSASIPFDPEHRNLTDLWRLRGSETPLVMLESTKRGRYSIYSCNDSSNFRIEYLNGECSLYVGYKTVANASVAIDRAEMVKVLEIFMCSQQINDDSSDIPFRGGLVGFLSYEFGIDSLSLDARYMEGERLIPDLSLLWVDRSIVVDNETKRVYIQSIRGVSSLRGCNDGAWVAETSHLLQRNEPTDPIKSGPNDSMQLHLALSSSTFSMPDHDRYIAQIRDCQAELLAGNSYELCLTTEATVTSPKNESEVDHDYSFLLYNNIQRHNPVPFAAYIRLNKTTILSSSPEQFLSWSRAGTIDMVPMKGTVKRTPEMTLEKATEILSSAKESAENLMIADLIRHDLYTVVSRDALVEVVRLCDVVTTETVYSLVSHIRAHVPIPAGTSRDSSASITQMIKYGIRALTTALPPGSMTGAPKKRSCEILHHLEQRHRGVYSGAIGYMDVTGNGAWSVCIRTAFSHADEDVPARDEQSPAMQKWHIGAGGAITVLSDEEQEWEEMMTKLESVLKGFKTHGDVAGLQELIERHRNPSGPLEREIAKERLESLERALEASTL